MNTLTISIGTFLINGTFKSSSSPKFGFLAEDSSFNHSDFTSHSWEDFKEKYPTRLSIMKHLEESMCFSTLDYLVDEHDKVNAPDDTMDIHDRFGQKHELVFKEILFVGDEQLYS